jgi:hypothetical protein
MKGTHLSPENPSSRYKVRQLIGGYNSSTTRESRDPEASIPTPVSQVARSIQNVNKHTNLTLQSTEIRTFFMYDLINVRNRSSLRQPRTVLPRSAADCCGPRPKGRAMNEICLPNGSWKIERSVSFFCIIQRGKAYLNTLVQI